MTGESGDAIPAEPDYYTIRYAGADGATQWESRYDGLMEVDDKPQAISMDGRGDVIVAGTARLLKYSASTGVNLWQTSLSGTPRTIPYAMITDLRGDVILAGGLFPGNGNADLWLAKFDGAGGSKLWERFYDGGSGDRATAVAVNIHGDIAVTGVSEKTLSPSDYYTAKYSSDGTLRWAVRADAGTGDSDLPVGVVMESGGHVIVTGTIDNTEGVFTIKHAGDDGAVLWTSIGPGAARGIGLDSTNNPFILSEDALDFARSASVHKLRAADGGEVWEVSADVPRFGAMAIDADGNIVITGRMSGASLVDYKTVKYASLNGETLWSRSYNGPLNQADAALGIALDDRNNPLVTGFTTVTTSSSTDFYTIQYGGVDGAILREAAFNSQAMASDTPVENTRCIAASSLGTVAVTGTARSSSVSGDTDIVTLLYQHTATGIVVEQPAGRSLPTNANVSIGDATVGHVFPAKTFTVRNAGTSTLNVASVEISGGDANHFARSTLTFPVVLNPGGIVNIDVSFMTDDAASDGTKFATLSILSSDPNRNSFIVRLTGRVLTPFDLWRVAHFGESSETGQGAANLDPDHDTSDNLVEYAFGSDPAVPSIDFVGRSMVSSSLGIPVIRVDLAAPTTTVLMFGRRKDAAAAGLLYTPQVSSDLVDWHDITINPSILASDPEIELVTVPLPETEGTVAPVSFCRVLVSAIP